MPSKHFDPDTQLARAYLPRDETLGPMAERAFRLIELRKLFRASIPEGLCDVCEVANLHRNNAGQDILVVQAANSASAAKLRQLCPRLTTLFQKRGWQVNSIKITVQGS